MGGQEKENEKPRKDFFQLLISFLL
jgi:hypothetical protein